MKVICPRCKKEVDVTKHGKIAPHKHEGVRCGGTGKRVEVKQEKKQ